MLKILPKPFSVEVKLTLTTQRNIKPTKTVEVKVFNQPFKALLTMALMQFIPEIHE